MDARSTASRVVPPVLAGLVAAVLVVGLGVLALGLAYAYGAPGLVALAVACAIAFGAAGVAVGRQRSLRGPAERSATD